MNWLKKLFTSHNWAEIGIGDCQNRHNKEIPKWVYNKANYFYCNQKINPYDQVIFFKGKSFRYKVWFESISQGVLRWHFYRKPRFKTL